MCIQDKSEKGMDMPRGAPQMGPGGPAGQLGAPGGLWETVAPGWGAANPELAGFPPGPPMRAASLDLNMSPDGLLPVGEQRDAWPEAALLLQARPKTTICVGLGAASGAAHAHAAGVPRQSQIEA